MSKNYLIEYEDGITKTRFYAKPSYNELQSAIDEIAEHFPYEKRLWDLTNINFNLTEDEIKAISEYGKSKFLKPNKIALLTSSDLAYGEMRQFMVYREQSGHSEAMVFRDMQKAIDWLNQ